MAGYGNRTAPDISPETLSHDHASTRLDLTDSHSTPTYATGYGNHTATTAGLSPSSSNDPSSPDTDSKRFDTQSRHGSAPYSNAHVYGSASTAGAGWGNKTGSFGDSHERGSGGGKDSVVGKIVEGVGRVVHSEGLVGKGRGMREGAGDGDRVGEGPVAN
ncbi:hypothetical protein E8E13_004268 [Curvularia kusanoi]|uniref:Uncharacterized protein n=1 Tax=Curvularia kusanoi TaxID=90978 RepID=A0A9P4W7Y1_CURKU|nr:hypothetical protein E8E13_004268 [Curvularia kusanoi]